VIRFRHRGSSAEASWITFPREGAIARRGYAALRRALLIAALLLGAGPGRAQEPSPTPAAAVPTSNPQPAPDAGRAVSWKLLVPNILHDQKPVWLFPLHAAEGQHTKPTLAFILATAGLVALDPHDTPYFRRTTSFDGFNRTFSGRNTALATAVVPLSFYAVGLARRDSYAQQTSLLVGEAVADAEILTTVMKNVDRRLRPYDIPPDGDFAHTWFKAKGRFLSGRGSFPSGHTIAAFSVATVFASRYRQHRWVPWVAYGLAGLVGFSRLPLQSHFPSDVFAGAVLGYVLSHDVVLARR
jgi:membrane-associated phospholipid phosphatase